MDEKHQPIIIKKVKKKHGGAAHGGSWKVAYADFVTAMMAFFLLLWLLSMVSEEKRAALSEYFRQYSIFQESGSTAVTTRDVKLTDPRFPSESAQPTLKSSDLKTQGKGTLDAFKRSKKNVTAGDEEIAKKIRTSIDDKMAGMRNQILVDIVEGGIRIQIIDSEGAMMFPIGSDQPTSKAKEILKLVAENLKDIPGQIAVEGHTDAAPMKSGKITNWELSTARASAARRELEAGGLDPSRIARVTGFADQELLIPLDPLDQRNRRISIIILQPQAN